jgi:U3 small nucleolar RNA-associated protein 23
MRHGRAKAARRTLQFLARTQGYKLPYNVLLDGTFCVAAMRMKIPVLDRLTRLLQQHEDDKIRFYVTESTLSELKTLAEQSKKQQEYFQQAYAWVQDHAEAIAKPTASTSDAKNVTLSETAQDIFQVLVTMDEYSTKYFLASQDEPLLHAARNHAVPCIRLSRTVLLLEQPSKIADRQAEGMEKRKWKDAVPDDEKELAKMIRIEAKQKQSTSVSSHSTTQRVKKKAKGPNPLSCKRKETEKKSSQSATKKRKPNET